MVAGRKADGSKPQGKIGVVKQDDLILQWRTVQKMVRRFRRAAVKAAGAGLWQM